MLLCRGGPCTILYSLSLLWALFGFSFVLWMNGGGRTCRIETLLRHQRRTVIILDKCDLHRIHVVAGVGRGFWNVGSFARCAAWISYSPLYLGHLQIKRSKSKAQHYTHKKENSPKS